MHPQSQQSAYSHPALQQVLRNCCTLAVYYSCCTSFYFLQLLQDLKQSPSGMPGPTKGSRSLVLPFAGESEPLVAVGTCQSFGEDYPATGRVLFFQITRKPGSGSEEEGEWDAKMIYSRCTAEPPGNWGSHLPVLTEHMMQSKQWCLTTVALCKSSE